ncbi:MAG: protein kinase [Actinomycetota bacterium]
MDARSGTEFAGYRIEEVIGRGGMGVVYLAADPKLDRKVALKVLPPDLARDQKFRDRFIRESQIAAGLEHPNVLPVYEAGEFDGQLFIAMRYVRGIDLRAVLNAEGPLAPDRAVSVIADVAAALDEAHAEGLIHRDVKPANILLTPARGPGSPERAYLTDFGVTRRTTSRSGITQTGEFMGTVDYAAPEQIEGKPIDGRADVYSTGCVLYECLTGEPPFVRDTDVAIMYAHLRDRPPNPSAKRPGLPQGLDPVVAKAMSKAPQDRHQSAGDLAGAARMAVGAPVAMPRRRLSRTQRMVAAGLALSVIAAGAAVALTRSDRPHARRANAEGAGPAKPGGLVRIDPGSGDVTSTLGLVSLGDPGLAFGEGFLWLLSRDGIRKINAEGNALGTPISGTVPAGCGAGFSCPVAIAAGEGALWVIRTSPLGLGGIGSEDSFLARVDPRTNRLEEFVLPGIAIGGAFSTLPLATGKGWVWTVDRSPPALIRIDPADAERRARFPLPSPGDGIAVGFGSVWIRHNTGIESSISRVDPGSGELLDETVLPGSADGLALGSGSVWVSDSSSDELVRIDPVTGSIAAHFEVGVDPRAVVIAEDGSVWVNLTGEGAHGIIAEVDPATRAVVERINLGETHPFPVRLAHPTAVVGFGSIWVA